MIFLILITEIYHDSSNVYHQIQLNQIIKSTEVFIKHKKPNQTKTKQYLITEDVTVSWWSSCYDADPISERLGFNRPLSH